ncbi:cellulose synthase [Thermopolyspora sp. NPDC052614]|uniref:cellulose synthase n=1 Tax=Thermopolyspora sp. NPDC052614 TaxID=3155682 RepID=UPI003443707F
MTFDQIAWFPLCAGLTAAGLVLAFLAFRRRGVGSGLRMTAWALLPMAAYLTGALQTLWQIGTAAVSFVTGLVLSPAVWAGVILAGLSALLFVVSGVIRRRGRSASGGATAQAPAAAGRDRGRAQPAAQPARPTQPLPPKRQEPVADDDFSDIEDILKRRGIS